MLQIEGGPIVQECHVPVGSVDILSAAGGDEDNLKLEGIIEIIFIIALNPLADLQGKHPHPVDRPFRSALDEAAL